MSSPSTTSLPSPLRSAAGPSLWAEIWNNRSILWLLTRRDLKARYAGSMLGVMWNVIHPIVMIVIFIVILGTIMNARVGHGASGHKSYALLLCAGMIPWLAFREMVTRCSVTILENAGLIKKVAFPEIILHLSVLINTVIIHAISYATFIVILLLAGAWPGMQLLYCFPLLIAAACFGLGFGLIVSVLNIYFRDVGQLVEIFLQFLFWFTPIVYTSEQLYDSAKDNPFVLCVIRLLQWNPLYHFTGLSQWMFGSSYAAFSRVSLAVVLLAPPVSLAIGLLLFNRFKHDMLDNI